MDRFGGFSLTETNVLALVICEKTITDVSGQKSLIGIINGMNVAQTPIAIPNLHIYLELCPAPGDLGPFYFGVFDPNGTPILKSAVQLPPEIPAGMAIQIDFAVNGLVFPAVGVYSFQLFSDGRNLLERKFYVQMPPPPPQEQVDSPTP